MEISLNRLSIGYLAKHGPVSVQTGISATLREGEFVCLLGPNGAGKSTLLRTLAGFTPALSGHIMIGEKPLASMNDAELARTVGVVLTERPSVSAMTVEQLVALGRSPYTGFWGRLSDADRKAVAEALELTHTASLADRLVDTLSDGERQRVMVAKALAQHTRVILLDEPTAFLDFPSKAEMMHLLSRLAHERKLIILQSTHDINMALATADRLWLLHDSLGFAQGSPAELAASGELPRYFQGPHISFKPNPPQFFVK